MLPRSVNTPGCLLTHCCSSLRHLYTGSNFPDSWVFYFTDHPKHHILDMATSTVAKSRKSGVNTVTLLVGRKKTAFRVHEDLLLESSTYFKAAFGPGFEKAPVVR